MGNPELVLSNIDCEIAPQFANAQLPFPKILFRRSSP